MPRVAIVTGAAGGLGAAIARRLHADGLSVVVADLDARAASVVADEIAAGPRAAAVAAAPPPNADAAVADPGHPPAALGLAVDVADPASAQALVDATLQRFGRLDVLVNNAGIAGPSAPVQDYPPDAFARVLAVNLGGTFHCTRAALPPMLAAGWGRIVNVASIAGKDGNPNMSAYSASKAGVIALTKSVGKETAASGVLVNCVVPGVVDAGLTDHTTDEERALFLSRVPMGRMGRPEELAELVSWLASERCAFSTGAAYDFSGGRAVY